MKNKWLVTAIAIAGAVTVAQAVPVAGFTGNATLPSTVTAGNSINVDYSVDLNGAGVYTYSYVVNNPATDTTTVDFFNVGFDTTFPGAVTGTGNSTTVGVDGVNWLISAVAAGSSSGTLYFTSSLPPTWGTANAQDHNPPSPWASGDLLPVPKVPDGGATVMLLGSALFGLGFLRKKLMA